MLLGFLLVLLVLVCIALAAVILLQRSEGGALGMGGGPSGFMSARGAGDLLTRITSILAAVFFTLCLLLTILSGRAHQGGSVVDRLRVDALNPDALNRSVRPTAPTPALGAVEPSAASQFDAPPPQVHTAPAAAGAAPASTPPAAAADNGARTRTSDRIGIQGSPQSTPTVAPGAPAGPGAAQTAPH